MDNPMIFVKAAGSNVKLRCECGREFWWSQEGANSVPSPEKPGFKTASCPDCKIIWSGVCVTSFRRKWFVAAKIKNKWSCIGIFEADSFTTLAIGLQEALPILFVANIEGTHFEEISSERYREIERGLKESNNRHGEVLKELLQRMEEEMLSDRPGDQDADPSR